MAEKPPWFKMDPAKFLQDSIVDGMTTLELGASFRLLCRQWIDGYVPDDLDRLARLCRVDRSSMGDLWVTLCHFFPEVETGKRANRFMWIEREIVVSEMGKKSSAGRDSANRRWDKVK